MGRKRSFCQERWQWEQSEDHEAVACGDGGSDPEDPRGAGARRSADAEVRLTWTALRLLFILNPYRVGVNSSDFIPTPDNVIVLLVTNRQRAAGDKARL